MKDLAMAMKPFLYAYTLGLIFITFPNIADSRTLSLPLERRDIPARVPRSAQLHKRGTVQTDLVNGQGPTTDRTYMIFVTIGSNQQSIGLDFDTGSRDIWVSRAVCVVGTEN
jgi:hypothetical protein